ncbi:MAG: 2-dehydropantoate 2-reductase [Methanobacteriota archaeon]
MKIVVLGAGAIGSLFGAFLSRNNSVVLVGRTRQKTAIRKQGLTISGKTNLRLQLSVEDSVHDVTIQPDLIILTVKSYDTKQAMDDVRSLITPSTLVLSLQNGLGNLETIEQVVNKEHVFGGVTTHGAFLVRPGVVQHTGLGWTVLGGLQKGNTAHLRRLVTVFNVAGVTTRVSTDFQKEVWKKAIINSCINPVTAVFSCKNGYLLQNPILSHVVNTICCESTLVARSQGVSVTVPTMIRMTNQVIRETAENYSSMVQSIRQGKKTEIDAITGVIVRIGAQRQIETPLNTVLLSLITSGIIKKEYY